MAKNVKPKSNRPEGEMLLYGVIGDTVTAADFVKELNALAQKCGNINVHVNSPGGSIFDGFAIYNAIKNCPLPVSIYIDGMCASIAASIALAGDFIYMSKIARFMTHRAQGGLSGNADELRNYASLLDGLENDMGQLLSARTGLSAKDAGAKYITGSDRWLTAAEAEKEGLIDGIYDADTTTTTGVPENISTHAELFNYYKQTLTNKLQTVKMDEIVLTAENAAVLGIGTKPTADALAGAVTALVAKNRQLDARNTELQSKVDTLQIATIKNEVKAQLDKALDEKRITVELSNTLAAKYSDDPKGLKELLAAMKPYAPVTGAIQEAGNGQTDRYGKFKAMSWGDLDMATNAGYNLTTLKAEFPDLYKEKFEEEYSK